MRTGIKKRKLTTTGTARENEAIKTGSKYVKCENPVEYLCLEAGGLLTIRVVAKNYVKPEKVQEFMGLCRNLVEATLKEEGCIDYGLHQELENSGILTFLEEWEDENSLGKHLNSNHFREIFPLLSECLEKKTEVNIYRRSL